MRVIQKHDVVGRRLVQVLALSEHDRGMHVCDCLVVLDSGLVFRLPGFLDEPFVPAEPPRGALPIEDPRLRDLCGATVVGLLRPRLDDDVYPGTIVLQLSTGIGIIHEAAAPEGLGAAGIHFVDLEHIQGGGLIDFWQGSGASPKGPADEQGC